MRNSKNPIGALISRDNGSSWQAYARSDEAFGGIYSLGGSAALGPQGEVVGWFPLTGFPDGRGEVYAFRLETREPLNAGQTRP